MKHLFSFFGKKRAYYRKSTLSAYSRLSTALRPTPISFKKRMEAAEELLRTTELSVKDIAAKLTFSDSNYFFQGLLKSIPAYPLSRIAGKTVVLTQLK